MNIYKITNKINGKQYIGITKKETSARWRQHLHSAFKLNCQYQFHRAIRKYGSSGFIVETIDSANTVSEAQEKERKYVREANSYHEGYNSTFGGDHCIDSNWQRENQLKRVANGTHPFLGGTIQRESSRARWKDGTNSIQNLNQSRIAEGTHNFQGDRNPARRLATEGLHHNQRHPWLNSKANPAVWKIAHQIFEQWKASGWSYRNLQHHFNTTTHLGKMVEKFKQGWIPRNDPEWLSWSGQE